ncbi:MAG: hypothetical protein M3P95_10135 [Actinomycetota bacterium]|nr:hypothetical protein [Actinomycetota bacterium]
MTGTRLLPPGLHADSLHELVELYVQTALAGGDLAALPALRLLRDRVTYLLDAHAELAHHVDGHPWHEVGQALGVTASALSARDRARRAPGSATPVRS